MRHIVRWWWKVGEFRIIIENRYSISPLGMFVQPMIVPTHVGWKEQRQIISRELATANIDICALSEVRREGTGNIVERDHTIHWSGAGVGFAVSNRLSNVTLELKPVSERIMVLRLHLKSGKFLKLVSVYGPTMQRYEPFFWQRGVE